MSATEFDPYRGTTTDGRTMLPGPDAVLCGQLLELKRLEWMREAWNALPEDHKARLASNLVSSMFAKFAPKDANGAWWGLERLVGNELLVKHFTDEHWATLTDAFVRSIVHAMKNTRDADLRYAIQEFLRMHAAAVSEQVQRVQADIALQSMKG